MTSWQDIQKEILDGRAPNKPAGDFDGVRRGKYKLVSGITGRPLLVYTTAFHNPVKAQIAAPFLTIDLSDKDGFYEIIRNIKSKEVDVFLHSPGGSAEATESIVKMLRDRFEKVRFIVTGAAKSAATILALSGDSILMDTAAELGPIDPQVRVRGRFSPAGSIIEQFDRAAKELKKDPSQLPVWIPILQEFAPSLLVECENFIRLSKRLTTNWLTDFMFRGEKDAKKKSKKIADFLTDEKNTLSHARRIDANQLKKLEVKIELLEEQEDKLQDAIRQLHLAVMATLDGTGAAKIFENSEGAALIRMVNIQVTPTPLPRQQPSQQRPTQQ
ncbi:ATP-dependent Clp protease proteolytic subunit [Candidatus Aerophobetes bacterium]|nr:ATP-dependent Clp protease proteolytic subunit [Candidatus Aerophobetes bacterium]